MTNEQKQQQQQRCIDGLEFSGNKYASQKTNLAKVQHCVHSSLCTQHSNIIRFFFDLLIWYRRIQVRLLIPAIHVMSVHCLFISLYRLELCTQLKTYKKNLFKFFFHHIMVVTKNSTKKIECFADYK